MPDTGAPWNIPYIEPTDLVRQYPAADEAQALAVAAGLSAAGNAGIGSNVVQTVKTDTFTTSSTSMTDITGYTVTITPTSDTSKILVFMDLAIAPAGGGGDQRPAMRLLRGSTAIYEGAAEGSRGLYMASFVNAGVSETTQFDTQSVLYRVGGVFLDSPGVDTAVTYKVQVRTNAGTVFINRSVNDTDNVNTPRAASSLTVIEVAP
jgi:hypothetical protein